MCHFVIRSGGSQGNDDGPQSPQSYEDLGAGSVGWGAYHHGVARSDPSTGQELSSGRCSTMELAKCRCGRIEADGGWQSPIAKFLDKRGPGIQQIAYRVSDLDSLTERLRDQGIRLLYDAPRPGTANSRINLAPIS